MSAKHKQRRAKEKDKLKETRQVVTKSVPLPSQDRQRGIGTKKQPTVPEEHGQREAVNKIPDVEIPPPVPPFDQLEKIAAREKTGSCRGLVDRASIRPSCDRVRG